MQLNISIISYMAKSMHSVFHRSLNAKCLHNTKKTTQCHPKNGPNFLDYSTENMV